MLPYFKVNIKLQESRQSVQEEGLPDDRSSTGQQQHHRNTPTVSDKRESDSMQKGQSFQTNDWHTKPQELQPF